MLLSIITINYNNKIGLSKTIHSIESQTSKDFEYIIIDGGSSDGSTDIIQQHSPNISYWISEKDTGIYNAMNKGIKVAHGEYLLFMNSGDCLFDNMTVEKVLPKLSEKKADLYVGCTLFMYKHPKLIIPPTRLTATFLITNSFNHQASFLRASRLKDRPYREDLKIVSDWYHNLYEILFNNAIYEKLEGITVARYDMTGISSTNLTVHDAEKEQCLLQLFPQMVVDNILQREIITEDPIEKKRRDKIEKCFSQQSRLACSFKLFRNSIKWVLADLFQ